VQTVTTLLALAGSILVAAAYVASTYTLGKWVVRELRSEYSGLTLLCRFSVGAALLGTTVTLLAMAHLAFTPVVLAVAFAPLAIALVRRPRSLGMPAFCGLPAGWTAPHLLIVACILLVASYAIPFTLAPPRGGDMAIYHLVVARSVAWENGLVFNPNLNYNGLAFITMTTDDGALTDTDLSTITVFGSGLRAFVDAAGIWRRKLAGRYDVSSLRELS